MVRPSLVQHANLLVALIVIASLGLFLLIANLAELPTPRRGAIELLLAAPLLFYAIVSRAAGRRAGRAQRVTPDPDAEIARVRRQPSEQE